MVIKSQNIFKTKDAIAQQDRHERNRHRGAVVWFTGLSASGKSTLATMLEKRLFEDGHQVYVLDGDNVRHGLCSDLGFSATDREENIRRIGEVAALFAEAGFIVISAFISPYRRDRRQARNAFENNFHEIYLNTDLAVCEGRDPKGLYAKARSGQVLDFTGISAPYEAPELAELEVNTGMGTADESLDQIYDYIKNNITL